VDIGFGAAVAGAWATPRNLAELGRRAERVVLMVAGLPLVVKGPPA